MNTRKIPQEMINDAQKLYLEYGGRRHKKIEAAMRARGWHFYREMLYTRRNSHGVMPGWPERFGWHKLLSPDQRAGLGKRHGGRNRFEAWLRKTFPEWTWTWRYQRYIYRKLADFSSGRSRRLMIFLPPRHGKSETVTVRYTAWRLLRDPTLNVILGSYNQRLADRFSRKIKRIAGNAGAPEKNETGSEVCKAPVPPPRPLSTASEWETPGGGGVRSVGVGAGIAGFGAGLIVIDDPVRNRADAESKVYRDRVWEWFNDDIYTRMDPHASIILIQTRWHEDDLAGRLLCEQKDGGEQWDVVSLPALAEGGIENGELKDPIENGELIIENKNKIGNSDPKTLNSQLLTINSVPDPLGRRPGAALCPQRFSVETLLRYKKKLGSYSFSALYQQNPAPADGGMFKRSWFDKIIDRAPDGLRWKRGWDLAVSIRTSADYTASFRCAFDRGGNLYIADGVRGRLEFPDQRRLVMERMRDDRNTEHGIEKALHGQAFVQELRRMPELRRYAFRPVRVEGDKLTRALTWLNLAEEGKVILVRGPWIDEFLDEVSRFPNGRHDDQIDAVSIAVRMLTSPDQRLYVF